MNNKESKSKNEDSDITLSLCVFRFFQETDDHL